jgi:hypothetical protein
MDTLIKKINILCELKLFDKYITEHILTFLLYEFKSDILQLDETETYDIQKLYIIYSSFMDLKLINTFPQLDIYSIFNNIHMKYYIKHKYDIIDSQSCFGEFTKKIFYDINYSKYTLIHFIFYNVLRFYTKDIKQIYDCKGNIKNLDLMFNDDYADSYTHYKLFLSCKYITALYYKINYSKCEKIEDIMKFIKNNNIQYDKSDSFKYSTNYTECAYYECYDYGYLYELGEDLTFNIMIDDFMTNCDMNNFIKKIYDNIDKHPYLEI